MKTDNSDVWTELGNIWRVQGRLPRQRKWWSMVRAMTQAERVLDGIREPEKEVSQSVQRRALAKGIFGEVHAIWTPSCAGIRSIQAYTSLWESKKLIRWWDCSQKQSWRVADYVTRMEKLRKILSWLRSIKDWLRCWIWTPDSITSDRIWWWCGNIWSKLMLIPECGITESTEFTTRELRSSESSSKNTCRHYDSSR